MAMAPAPPEGNLSHTSLSTLLRHGTRLFFGHLRLFLAAIVVHLIPIIGQVMLAIVLVLLVRHFAENLDREATLTLMAVPYSVILALPPGLGLLLAARASLQGHHLDQSGTLPPHATKLGLPAYLIGGLLPLCVLLVILLVIVGASLALPWAPDNDEPETVAEYLAIVAVGVGSFVAVCFIAPLVAPIYPLLAGGARAIHAIRDGVRLGLRHYRHFLRSCTALLLVNALLAISMVGQVLFPLTLPWSMAVMTLAYLQVAPPATAASEGSNCSCTESV